MKKGTAMKATSLRNALVTIIILVIGSAGVSFYFAQQYLRTIATDVSHSLSDATMNTGGSQSLKDTQEMLITNQAVATKAAALFSPSQAYQSQVVHDLGVYATNAGVNIEDYNFLASTATSTTTTSTPKAIVGGAGSTSFTVTIASPVEFTNLMKFMSAIEQSIPKMQISSINISPSTDTSMVTTDALTIEIYTR